VITGWPGTRSGARGTVGDQGVPVDIVQRTPRPERFDERRPGGSQLNYSIYHDRYQRTVDGWKFAERVFEVRYFDTTALPGSAGPRSNSVEAQVGRPHASPTDAG